MNSCKLFASRLLLLAVTAGFITVSCTKKEKVDEKVLAQINDLKVTEAHLEASFLKYYYKSGQSLKPSYSTKANILDAEFNTYVMAVYARDEGLHETVDARQMQEMIRRRVLNEEFMNREVLSAVEVTDNEVRNMFVKFNTVLRASHLYAPDKKTADALYQEIQAGKDFEELAKEVFHNSKLANSGGDLGEFTVDEMDPAFEREAFKLSIGEISKPVRTAQGYSIIKLTDRFTKPVLTEYQFARKKDQFAYFAEKQKKEIAKRDHMYDFLAQLTIDEDMLEELWKSISSNITSFVSADPEFYRRKKTREVLAQAEGFTLTQEDFFKEAFLTPDANRSNITGKKTLENFIKGIAYRGYLFEQASNAGIGQVNDVQASIKQTYIEFLARKAETSLQEQISISDDEIRRKYVTDKEDFIKPLEINLARIIVADQEKAKAIVEKIDAGASFSAMVDEHTINNEERLRGGRLGFDYINNYGFLSKKLADLQPGDISDPLFYQSGVYHIYKCLGRKEARQLSYTEAKKRVRQKILNEKLEDLREQTIESVKAKHDAIMNMERLKKITIQI
ncbi:MAG: hypothetical protein FH748_08335 [Balneolaceae bacterium]|nr:hypothetical protein [Balneolaceae bacterium]